jgi:hypothetical protein
LKWALSISIRTNFALDDAPLAPLERISNANIRIVSNQPGLSLLTPCPWLNDAFCDERRGDCAPGSDAVDCAGSAPPVPGDNAAP